MRLFRRSYESSDMFRRAECRRRSSVFYTDVYPSGGECDCCQEDNVKLRNYIVMRGGGETVSSPRDDIGSVAREPSESEDMVLPALCVSQEQGEVGMKPRLGVALVDHCPSPYDKEALSFKAGDRIIISRMSATGLWRGWVRGGGGEERKERKEGNFKFIHVRVCTELEERFEGLNLSQSVSMKSFLKSCNLSVLHPLLSLNGFEDISSLLRISKDDMEFLGIEANQQTILLNQIQKIFNNSSVSSLVPAQQTTCCPPEEDSVSGYQADSGQSTISGYQPSVSITTLSGQVDESQEAPDIVPTINSSQLSHQQIKMNSIDVSGDRPDILSHINSSHSHDTCDKPDDSSQKLLHSTEEALPTKKSEFSSHFSISTKVSRHEDLSLCTKVSTDAVHLRDSISIRVSSYNSSQPKISNFTSFNSVDNNSTSDPCQVDVTSSKSIPLQHQPTVFNSNSLKFNISDSDISHNNTKSQSRFQVSMSSSNSSQINSKGINSSQTKDFNSEDSDISQVSISSSPSVQSRTPLPSHLHRRSQSGPASPTPCSRAPSAFHVEPDAMNLTVTSPTDSGVDMSSLSSDERSSSVFSVYISSPMVSSSSSSEDVRKPVDSFLYRHQSNYPNCLVVNI